MELFRNLDEEEKIEKLVEALFWLAEAIAELDYDIRAIRNAMANEGKTGDYSCISLEELKDGFEEYLAGSILGIPFLK